MQSHLLNFKRQTEAGLAIGKQFVKLRRMRRFDRVVFFGMGGSAMSGDVLGAMAGHYSRTPFTVHRDFSYASKIGKKAFVILSSYSGNTEEILRTAAQIRLPARQIMVVTSGGKLMQWAAKKKVACAVLPPGLPPRAALGYLTFAVLPALEKIAGFRVPQPHLREMLRVLSKDWKSPARKLAAKLYGKSVHLYAAAVAEPVLVRWRAQLAENSKVLASHHVIPEMLHNEIQGWKHPSAIVRKSAAVFFRDGEDRWTAKKMGKAAILIRKAGAQAIFVPSEGRSVLARLLGWICLGDWVSVELARRYRENPMRIPAIELLKDQ